MIDGFWENSTFYGYTNSKLVSMYSVAWISTLQVVYNNSYTALNLVCYYVN